MAKSAGKKILTFFCGVPVAPPGYVWTPLAGGGAGPGQVLGGGGHPPPKPSMRSSYRTLAGIHQNQPRQQRQGPLCARGSAGLRGRGGSRRGGPSWRGGGRRTGGGAARRRRGGRSPPRCSDAQSAVGKFTNKKEMCKRGSSHVWVERGRQRRLIVPYKVITVA